MKQKITTDITFLKKKSEEVDEARANGIFSILEDSLDTSKGCGLSAVQIEILLRVSIVRLPKCKLNLFNPKIIEKEKPFRFRGEGCLSLPGLHVDTKRYLEIMVENGNGRKYYLEGLEAIAVQHEIDHTNGLTMLDRKWKKRR